MKGVKRYDENYNLSHYAPAGVYSADNFRENLAELLRVREMTQEEAARRCGVTPPVLNNWLQGRNEPSLYSFTCLCAGLEIEPNWLLAKHEPIRKGRSDR